jgi:hypothetical protein
MDYRDFRKWGLPDSFSATAHYRLSRSPDPTDDDGVGLSRSPDPAHDDGVAMMPSDSFSLELRLPETPPMPDRDDFIRDLAREVVALLVA